ncbi:MAG: metabolite traffic protein EboE [Salinivenus sp.]
MLVGSDGALHLTYCTNIHPGERWSEVASTLKEYLPPLKAEVAPDASFGVGLRLSNQAAETLLEGNRLSRFREWLDANDLYVFTLNGFPYGSFHGEQVKDRVYAPDWRSAERVAYTRRLARILVRLVPGDLSGSISTSPLSYKPWLNHEEREEAFRAGSQHLAEVAVVLARLESETGTHLHVDLEPEPDCLIENTEESIAFFEDWLWPVGGAHLADQLDVSKEEAISLLRRHVQLCYDTCHFAVEYETADAAFDRLSAAEVPVGKVQLSAALRATLPPDRSALAGQLQAFAEDTYLHQVVERRADGSLHRYPDLPDALPHIDRDDAEEWRIHYHVPIYTDTYGDLRSTRSHIGRTLEALAEDPFCPHLEIETYTWDVLPPDLKEDLPTSLQREYDWILSHVT